MLRRGFRGEKYVFEYDADLISGETTGVVLHYQDPENYMVFGLAHVTGTTVQPRLMRRKDGDFGTIATGSNFTLTSGDRVRVAIKDDPGNSALQKLEVYVAGTTRFNSTAIDDDWSAGLAGFYVRTGQTSTVTFDNVKIGYDNNADDDCDDGGDDVQIDDDFASNVMNLTYDNNGNLTDDGILKFVYDAWNGLVKSKRRVDAETVIATNSYDGASRRTKNVVANQGVEIVANDGGNTTVNYYFDRQPRATETRNGSNQTTAHYIWGTGRDELLLAEVNGDTTIGNDSSPDITDSGENAESPADTRYYMLATVTGRVAAIAEYDVTGVDNGRVVERVLGLTTIGGNLGAGELGSSRSASRIGLTLDIPRISNCQQSLVNALADPAVRTLYDYLISEGCLTPADVHCAADGESCNGYDPQTNMITLCGNFDRFVLMHELIHALQECVDPNGGLSPPGDKACREFQAAYCSGECPDPGARGPERCNRTKCAAKHCIASLRNAGIPPNRALALCTAASTLPKCSDCSGIPGAEP